MQSKAKTVEEYLAELPEDRRQAISILRETFNKNLPAGYEEGMQYGMIGYYVPHSIFPSGYHCDATQPLPFASLASQKNHLAIYMMGIYIDSEVQEWFVSEWKKTGKKLDMGKSCIRFKKIEDVPLKVVGQVLKKMPVKKYVAKYESSLANYKTSKKQAKKAAPKTTAKKSKPTKVAKKKSATKASVKKVVKKTALKKTAVKKTPAKKAKAKSAKRKS